MVGEWWCHLVARVGWAADHRHKWEVPSAACRVAGSAARSVDAACLLRCPTRCSTRRCDAIAAVALDTSHGSVLNG